MLLFGWLPIHLLLLLILLTVGAKSSCWLSAPLSQRIIFDLFRPFRRVSLLNILCFLAKLLVSWLLSSCISLYSLVGTMDKQKREFPLHETASGAVQLWSAEVMQLWLCTRESQGRMSAYCAPCTQVWAPLVGWRQLKLGSMSASYSRSTSRWRAQRKVLQQLTELRAEHMEGKGAAAVGTRWAAAETTRDGGSAGPKELQMEPNVGHLKCHMAPVQGEHEEIWLWPVITTALFFFFFFFVLQQLISRFFDYYFFQSKLLSIKINCLIITRFF